MADENAVNANAASEPAQADAGGTGPQDLFAGASKAMETRPEVTPDQLGSDSAEQTGGAGAPQQAAVQPPQPRWKFKGREWADDELRQKYGEPEVIKDLLVTAEQFKSMQQKYMERMEYDRQQQIAQEQMRQQLAARQQAQQQQPQGPQNYDEFTESLKPRIQMLRESGLMDDDEIALNPKMANLVAHLVEENIRAKSSFMQFRDAALQVYNSQFRPILDQTQTAQAEYERQSWLSYLHQNLASLPQRHGEHFASLSDETKRNEFINFLAENVNPPIEVLQSEQAGDWLAGQYLAWQRSPILAALSAGNQQRTAAAATARQMARGESSATRGQADGGKNKDIRTLFAKS
jgi:hypothetical protein